MTSITFHIAGFHSTVTLLVYAFEQTLKEILGTHQLDLHVVKSRMSLNLQGVRDLIAFYALAMRLTFKPFLDGLRKHLWLISKPLTKIAQLLKRSFGH